MMPEMDANRPVYGTYEGQQRESVQPPPYEMGYQPPSAGGTIDDNFVDAISQRVAQQMAQQSSGKVYGQRRPSSGLPAEQRTGIAIVSVLVLIPLGVVLGQQGLGGLLALGVVGLVILAVNAIANGVLSLHD
jgi:hypothetical protein